MVATVGTSTTASKANGCFACAPLPAGADRDACLCRAPVGLPCAALILEPSPVEPEARLAHLRQRAAMAAGARQHAAREAKFQDKWDPGHARDLRTTSSHYAHAEQRIRREIESVKRELGGSKPTKGKKTPSRSTRRSNTRRTPGRTPRPAGRRASRQTAAGGGGDGDPPSGDPDPAPAPGAAASTAPLPPFKARALPGGADRVRAELSALTVRARARALASTPDMGESDALFRVDPLVALRAIASERRVSTPDDAGTSGAFALTTSESAPVAGQAPALSGSLAQAPLRAPDVRVGQRFLISAKARKRFPGSHFRRESLTRLVRAGSS